jgi:hypothetical protein
MVSDPSFRPSSLLQLGEVEFYMLKKNAIPLVVSGPDRRIFLPDGLLDRSEIPEYLTGEVPGE